MPMDQEQFDVLKQKILKFILFKKRTEYETRLKLTTLTKNDVAIENIMDFLKEEQYVDDQNYIKRYINEIKALKNISIKELKQKLYSKGLDLNLLDDYMDELYEYEQCSAKNIVLKKRNVYDTMQLKEYLFKKGFSKDSIETALYLID